MVRIGRGSLALCAICVVDLVSTMLGVTFLSIEEANPLMAFFLDKGLVAFCAAKLSSFIPAVLLLEWYRKRNPAFVSAVLKGAVAGYAALYGVSFWAVNILPRIVAR